MAIKISCIIPTYKRPQLVVKCIAALEKQSLSSEDFEVIVVTDGPDEETLFALQSLAVQHLLKNFCCINLQKKAGPAAARNKGASMARGELIAFTDDDCLPDAYWLENLWQAYNKEQKKEIALSGQTIVPYKVPPTDYEKNIAQLETADFITTNCACSKKAFEITGGFDEDFPTAWREDSDLHFKLIAAGIPILKISDAIVIHPVRKAKWGVSIREQKKGIYNALLYKKHPRLYKQKIGNKPLWNYYAIIFLLPVTIITLALHKKVLSFLCFAGWVFFVTQFVMKRLKGTSRNTKHITEMIVTSLIIPYLSVYWTLRGAIRYKRLLL